MFWHNFLLTVAFERKFLYILIIIVTNFVAVSSVGIKRADCTFDKEAPSLELCMKVKDSHPTYNQTQFRYRADH